MILLRESLYSKSFLYVPFAAMQNIDLILRSIIDNIDHRAVMVVWVKEIQTALNICIKTEYTDFALLQSLGL